MKTAALALLFALAVTTVSVSAQEPVYAVEDVSGIIRELSKDKYEQPVKEWLSQHRPEQFERLFGEQEEERQDGVKEDKGLLAIISELNSAIADPQIGMLDYYINAKASAGWEVVSMTDKVILFRRSRNEPGEQDGGKQPVTRPEAK
jgi:hypothetical protein